MLKRNLRRVFLLIVTIMVGVLFFLPTGTATAVEGDEPPEATFTSNISLQLEQPDPPGPTPDPPQPTPTPSPVINILSGTAQTGDYFYTILVTLLIIISIITIVLCCLLMKPSGKHVKCKKY